MSRMSICGLEIVSAKNALVLGRTAACPRIQVVGILDEADLDAEFGQRVVEQVVGAAIEPGAGHDVIARGGEVQDGERLGRLARGQKHRGHPAFQGGDALFDDVGGRVPDAGVDVAGDFQAEQGRGVSGVVEGVRRGLVDRQRAGVGGRVRRCWPAWICLVSNDQCAVGSVSDSVVTIGAFWGLVVDRMSRDRRGHFSGDSEDEVRRSRVQQLRRTMGQGPHKYASGFPVYSGGPVHGGPALADVAAAWLLNLVVFRGTPPRLEGCRPASRGLTLALMTEMKLSSSRRNGANGVPGVPTVTDCGQIEVDISGNVLDNVTARFTAKPVRI